MNADIDLRAMLPSINVPTLVLQAKDDLTNSLESGRDLASRIPNAKLVERDFKDHVPWGERSEAIIREIQDFLGEEEMVRVTDRVLTTVLFTDIVDSTQLANDFGDEKWSDLLEGHHETVRRELEIFRGHEVKTTGDGSRATFDGPARSVQCAANCRTAMSRSQQVGLVVVDCYSVFSIREH